MTQKIQIKRGLKNNLPLLEEGELALTTDAKEVYIGSNTGNVELANKVVVDALLAEIVQRLVALEQGGVSLPTDTIAPNNVTNLTAGTTTTTTIPITWVLSTSNDVAKYEVSYSSNNGISYTTASSLVNANSTSYTITGLTQNTNYMVRVVAIDTSSNRSTGVTVSTSTISSADTTPPNNITNLTAVNVSDVSVTLNWSASSSSDIASYDVLNGSTLLGNTTSTTYTVTGLTSSTAYVFWVKAKDTSGNMASGTSVNATTTALMPASIPTDFAIYEPPLAPNTWATASDNKSLAMTVNQFLTTFYEPYVGTQADGMVVTKTSLGKSQDGGFDLWEYDFKPANYTRTILLQSGMHTYELPGAFGLAHFIKHMMMTPYQHVGFRYLRENVRVKVIPIINPWGFNQNPKVYTNVNGVNPNRNWDSIRNPWSSFPSDAPFTFDYKGTAPFSEAETKIQRDWALANSDADFWFDMHCAITPPVDDIFIDVNSKDKKLGVIRSAKQKLKDRLISKYSVAPANIVEYEYVDDPTDARLFWVTENVPNMSSMVIEQTPLAGHYGGTDVNNEGIDITEYEVLIATYAFALLATGAGTDTTAPNNVTGLTSSNITTSGVTLTWTKSTSTDATNYDIFNGSTWVGNTESNTYNVTGLATGSTNTLWVKTRDKSLNLSSGTSIQVITTGAADTTPPNNVTNLTTSNVTSTGLTLSWTASSSSDIASYDIYNGATLLGNTVSTNYNITGLTASTAYTFWVKAKDASGNVASGTSVNATTTALAQFTTVLVSDSFNRANSATTLGTTDSYAGGTAKTWAVEGPGSPVYGIIGNQAYQVSGQWWDFQTATIDAGVANVKVTATFATISGYPSLVIRAVDAGNYIHLVTDGIGSPYRLEKLDTAVNYTPITSGGTSANGDVVSVTANGSSIIVTVNGTQIISTTSTDFTTATKFGISLDKDPANRVDNFKIEV